MIRRRPSPRFKSVNRKFTLSCLHTLLAIWVTCIGAIMARNVGIMVNSILLAVCVSASAQTPSPYMVSVTVTERSTTPILSYIDGTSTYHQVSNPAWVDATPGTGGKKGILVRTQNCTFAPIPDRQNCTWCGGSQDKASILTFSEQYADGTYAPVTRDSVVFGPSDDSDSWGTEDPRLDYNSVDQLYYMFYTAYNGTINTLNLATTKNPTGIVACFTRWLSNFETKFARP